MKFLNCILAGLLTIAQSQQLGASSLNQRQVQETQVTKTKEDAHAAIMDMYAATSSANAVRQQTTGSDIYELITTYEGGWIQDGVMFDVRAAPIAGSTASTSDENEGLVVLAFDILTPNKDEQVCVEIYTKQGTFEGHDTTQNSWTFLGSVSVLGQGKNKPTHIPIGSFDPTHIPLDATQAFYITTQNENMRYTAFKDAENKTGSVFVSENHSNQDSERGMSIEILTGVAKNYPFGESWPDRVFNGAMLYRLGNDLDMSSIFSEMSGKEVQESVAAKRGYATCDVDVAVDATVADQTTTKVNKIYSLVQLQ